MAVLLLAGCDERRSLCEKAVDKHIAKFGSYKITRFAEEDGEGKGISVYNVDYTIKKDNKMLIHGRISSDIIQF